MDHDTAKIFADFNNTGIMGRVRLNCTGTIRDIKLHEIEMSEGKEILLSDNDELETIGILHFSTEEKIWVAEINWKVFRKVK